MAWATSVHAVRSVGRAYQLRQVRVAMHAFDGPRRERRWGRRRRLVLRLSRDLVVECKRPDEARPLKRCGECEPCGVASRERQVGQDLAHPTDLPRHRMPRRRMPRHQPDTTSQSDATSIRCHVNQMARHQSDATSSRPPSRLRHAAHLLVDEELPTAVTERTHMLDPHAQVLGQSACHFEREHRPPEPMVIEQAR
jgi:hypothetical protein